MGRIENLERMLAAGQDDALLRYSLGSACLSEAQHEKAVQHLARAVELNPGYSAAWKIYGKALTELGRADAAISVYEQGIQVAEEQGDIQAAREMKVFLKRLHKDRPEPASD